jgi:hypothetical protein
MSTVTATITAPSGTPIDAMPVILARPDGSVLTTSTDAGGGIAVAASGALALTVPQALAIDGVPYAAGAILRLDVPETDGVVPLVACLTGVDDASPAALLARIAALTARVSALEGA